MEIILPRYTKKWRSWTVGNLFEAVQQVNGSRNLMLPPYYSPYTLA